MSAPVREISYEPGELVFPSTSGGRDHWTSPEVERIVHKMHHGDPTIGWEGDPRLALYHDRDCWVLERLEADGQMRPVCRSKPGLALDERLLIRLMEHDHRRGFDANKLEDGGRSQEDLDAEAADALARTYYEIGKQTA